MLHVALSRSEIASPRRKVHRVLRIGHQSIRVAYSPDIVQSYANLIPCSILPMLQRHFPRQDGYHPRLLLRPHSSFLTLPFLRRSHSFATAAVHPRTTQSVKVCELSLILCPAGEALAVMCKVRVVLEYELGSLASHQFLPSLENLASSLMSTPPHQRPTSFGSVPFILSKLRIPARPSIPLTMANSTSPSSTGGMGADGSTIGQTQVSSG